MKAKRWFECCSGTMNPGWVQVVSDPFLLAGQAWQMVQMKNGRRISARVAELFYTKPPKITDES